ncbi:MAG: exosortase system-associated protein, TIGR04073 family [Candidatus Omnitrophota bacterium]|nr:MAG: exosortase system-associated protein, TIGR04073 family [Candidatus Omnitrophota bacterium]
MVRRILLLVLLVQLLFFPLYADEYNPLRKLGRGVVNTGLFLVEVPIQMMKIGDAQGHMAGATWGFCKGMAFAVRRCLFGVYEVVTFLMPPSEPILEPEFIFSDIDESE